MLIPDFAPFVRLPPRHEKGTGFYAFLDRCAHRAFVNGKTEAEASQNLDTHCAENESQIHRSMVVLGLLPRSGKLDHIHRIGAARNAGCRCIKNA